MKLKFRGSDGLLLHVVKEIKIKIKITATFRASRRLRFENTKRIMSHEMRNVSGLSRNGPQSSISLCSQRVSYNRNSPIHTSWAQVIHVDRVTFNFAFLLLVFFVFFQEISGEVRKLSKLSCQTNSKRSAWIPITNCAPSMAHRP